MSHDPYVRFVWAASDAHGMAHLVRQTQTGVLAMRAACLVDAIHWKKDANGVRCGLCKEAKPHVAAN